VGGGRPGRPLAPTRVKEDVGGELPEEQDRQRRRVGGGSGERPWIRREKIRGGAGRVYGVVSRVRGSVGKGIDSII
jgi:hypothetical protein